MKHQLKIHSLNDGMADCNCGFHFVTVGETTKGHIKQLHDKLKTVI